MDLVDFRHAQASAETFTKRENRLDVLSARFLPFEGFDLLIGRL